MANYCCATRTNYFHVKDPNSFRKFMNKVTACEDNINVWEEKDRDGNLVFGFGCYGSILGVPVFDEEECSEDEYDCCDYDYDEFVNGLADLVSDDDAIIILESGNEKLRYLVGSAMIITSTSSEYLDISTIAAESAAKMLGNEKWKTKLEY